MEQRFLPGMSPGLTRVAKAAKRDPGKLLSLAHHLDVDALRRAFRRINKAAAVGVDGVTKEQYGENLEVNLRDLHKRMKSMKYRHQAIRRVLIDKDGGKKRQIGISTVEDKIVQDSLRELVEVIYEQDFLLCSYGYRPGRRPHDALRAISQAVHRGQVRVILEADIVSFFDKLDRKLLMELLQKRLADKSLLRLIGKCLHVGVLEGETLVSSSQGTTQGSTLSPLLANIYLHHVLDLWVEQNVKPRMRGHIIMARYADDFLIGFEYQEDADRVMKVLGKRLARFGLELHPDKTRLVSFRRPSKLRRGKGPNTFDFLGFTHIWKRSRNGYWFMVTRTRASSLQKAKKAIYERCRRQRHFPVEDQHAALVRQIRGHIGYFGVRGNEKQLKSLVDYATRSWQKWLNRRSHRSRLPWKRFLVLLRDYPLPSPKAHIPLWEML